MECYRKLDLQESNPKFSKGPFDLHPLTFENIHHELASLASHIESIATLLKIPFILSHGSLIGSYFNNATLPWDTDYDFYIFQHDAYKLKRYIMNMSKLKYADLPTRTRRENAKNTQISFHKSNSFLWYIDSNPRHHIPIRAHTKSGLYADISILENSTHKSRERYKHCQKKNYKSFHPPVFYHACGLWGSHMFRFSEFLPLRTCRTHNATFQCPKKVEMILRNEYSRISPTVKEFTFNRSSKCFEYNHRHKTIY